MLKMPCYAMMALLALSPVAHAAEPGTMPAPEAVVAIVGCWNGRGEVMGKPVTITITAKPIVQNAFVALDSESGAIADPEDRYSAHLLFGGSDKTPGATAAQIVGFWADSFGGAFTAEGRGESRQDGFEMTYRYAENAFVNRWRISGDRLTWQIVARDGKGLEKPFASYLLAKTTCDPSKIR